MIIHLAGLLVTINQIAQCQTDQFRQLTVSSRWLV